MSGAFQTSREIFSSTIWKNVTEFRIFFLIYGNAIFAEEGYRISDDLHLERGQWLRSTRKIQEDLEFIENRQVKKYSTATINRCIKSLVTSQRLCTKTHELGTVFTVVNYEVYQGFGSYRKENLEQDLEQSRNRDETVTKQRRNNNKKDNKDNNDKKVNKEDQKIKYAEYVRLSSEEYDKLILEYGEEMTKECIEILNTYKGSTGKTYKSDYMTMTPNAWVPKRYQEDQEKKLRVVNGGQYKGRPNTMSRLEELYKKAVEEEKDREASGHY